MMRIALQAVGLAFIAGCAGSAPRAVVVVGPLEVESPQHAGESGAWLVSPKECQLVLPARRERSFQSGAAGKGAVRPQLSPNGRTLAYAVADSLFLHDVETSVDSLAFVAPPSYRCLVTAWSPSGQHLLFFVSPPRGIFSPKDRGIAEFRLLNVRAKRLEAIELEYYADVAGWVNGREVIAKMPYGWGWQIRDLFTGGTRSAPIPSECRQVHVLPDKRIAVANLPARNEYGPTSTLLKVDLDTGETVIVAESDSYPGLQWPRLSPNGKRVAYSSWGDVGTCVMVDGKPVTELQPPYLHHWWINDTTLVVRGAAGIRVVDLEGIGE